MIKRITPCLMMLGSLILLPDQAQGVDDRPLVVNEAADTYAIAEQLYQQASSSELDAESRAAIMQRAAELFGEFIRRYPHASQYQRALYLLASCQKEAGDATASNRTLGKLANGMHGEYAAAAAYQLATQAMSRSLWDTARGYFTIAIRETKRDDIRHDSIYRLGRVQMQLGMRKEAEASFRSLMVLKNVKPQVMQASLMALAQMKTEDGQDAEAYPLFIHLLNQANLSLKMRGMATLQAARLAARLGKSQESQELYAQLARIPGMERYAGEAQMESIIALFKNKRYQEVVDMIRQQDAVLDDAGKEARRALIVGQSYMELKQYDSAAQWFEIVEQAQPDSEVAADAAYRRLICARQLRSSNFFTLAQKYLRQYAATGSETVELPCTNLVRLMYADRLMPVDVKEAARQFDALDISRLPLNVQADAEYKKAWCAAQVEGYDPVPTLDHFITTFKEDARLPEALALRGRALAKQGKVGQALKDFDLVIAKYPQSAAASVSWQCAAQACAETDPDKMVAYYEGLIRCGNRVKPAAIAEAHYNIANALYEKNPADAVPHFQEARTLNPEQYATLVNLRLVQCFFKMKDAAQLSQALQKLEAANEASYKGLPPAILRWCGWMCYQGRNYQMANKYLTDALSREPLEKYTNEQGVELTRPKAEPVVWKTLAKARLELRLFAPGLEAAQHYISMESQPYRKAEGMRDAAQLMIGLGRAEEAGKLCEEAIALGIDGPIKSSVFITLGDSYYVQKQYSEAAKYYGRTANVVSDKDLKPLSLYKIASALHRCGKDGEASRYEEMLKSEFPNWVPSGADQLLMIEQR